MLTKGVRLHNVNARPQIARATIALIQPFGWITVAQLPYRPALAWSEFHLFPELNKHMDGTHFETDDSNEAVS